PGPAACVSLLASASPPPARSSLFPYTTLFRSQDRGRARRRVGRSRRGRPRADRPAAVPSLRRPAGAAVRRQRRDRDRATEGVSRSEEHTSELQSRFDLVCRLLLEKKKDIYMTA